MKDEPAVIKIDPEGRYAFLIHGFISSRDELDAFQEHLNDWWNSGEKFLVVHAPYGVEVRLERMEE